MSLCKVSLLVTAASISCLISPLVICAQTTQPTISVLTDIEDSKKMLHATVTLNGKPMENVVLQYFVQRSFGNLLLGDDTTLDDGTSAVAFPVDLPGTSDGKLRVILKIKTPPQFSSVFTAAEFVPDMKALPVANAFPRALWAPQAPWPLMLSIAFLTTAIWSCYLFVVGQILAIRIGG